MLPANDVIDILNNIKSIPKPEPGIEIIQQWQYSGKVHPRLLDDSAFEFAKNSGITALQSYVTFAEIENKEGELNFSAYDILIEKIKKHGLKWVPFLILGPGYSIPDWFHDSDKSIYAKCLEHGDESRIQSIWNPFLPEMVDHFIKAFHDRYKHEDIIESVLLGISGNWGEAIYPVLGGFQGGFHTHVGWWCGDKYALDSFRLFLKNKFETIEYLNRSYKTNYKSFLEVSYPVKTINIHASSNTVVKIAKTIAHRYYKYKILIFRSIQKHIIKKLYFINLPSLSGYNKWLDFITWYQDEMTSWAEFWIKTARKYFNNERLYLVTGGDGSPQYGASFSGQVKTAKKYNAGIRITNQTDDYTESFILTRLVSSASRFYNSYFITEEAWINNPDGVTARIFDAATSGANGLYCKNITGTGYNHCTQKHFPAGLPTQGSLNLLENLHYITGVKPKIELAILFPNTSIALGTSISGVYRSCSKLRENIDFDLVDEIMIGDNVLDIYKFLVILECNWLKKNIIEKINGWIKKGGILIYPKFARMRIIDGNQNMGNSLYTQEEISNNGEGLLLRFNGLNNQKYLKFIVEAITNKKFTFPFKPINYFDYEIDNVFSSFCDNEILLFNSNDHLVTKEVRFYANNTEEMVNINIMPYSIKSIKFKNIF